MSLVQSIDTLNILALKSDYLKRVTPDLDKKSKHKLHNNPRQFDLDIQRYEELFDTRKLTYLEQETKERFLRAIINDSPFFVEQWDMKDVEEKTRSKKGYLKEEKLKTKELLATLDKQAKDIYSEYKFINETKERNYNLDMKIKDMEEELKILQSEYTELEIPHHSDPQLNNITSVEELQILENECMKEVNTLDDDFFNTNKSIEEALVVQLQLENDIDRLRIQRDNVEKSTSEMVKIRNEELKRGQKDNEITADFYKSMIECLLDLSELKDFEVIVGDDSMRDMIKPDNSTILHVKFSLLSASSMKFNLYINDLTGELLSTSTVSDIDQVIVSEALQYVSKVPPSTQAELFVKKIKEKTKLGK